MGSRFNVYDDHFEHELYENVEEWHARQSLHNVMQPGSGVRSHHDGNAVYGDTLVWSGDIVDDDILGRVTVAIKSLAMKETQLLGEYEQDWDAFTLTPWCHPAGSRLGWHTDLLDSGPTRVGAFTWYLNDDWEYDWGGHLQIIDSAYSDVEMVNQPSWKGNTPSVSSCIPDVIPPRANRFVIFKSGTWHSVSRVDSTAGDRMRRSIVGFFIKT